MPERRRDVFVNDGEMVEACLRGEAEAVAAFVARFQASVFGVCYRMLGQREDAEDVSQETFLRALRSLAQWDKVRPLTPWLLTIAVNRCRTFLAKRGARPGWSGIVEEPAARPVVRGADLGEELQLALEKLREEYRECFVLYHQSELSLAEISEVIGSPEGTIKTWLHRARKELAEHLQRRGIRPPSGRAPLRQTPVSR